MSDELRLKIIKGMLNEFPQLREEVKKWLLDNENPKFDNKAAGKRSQRASSTQNT